MPNYWKINVNDWGNLKLKKKNKLNLTSIGKNKNAFIKNIIKTINIAKNKLMLIYLLLQKENNITHVLFAMKRQKCTVIIVLTSITARLTRKLIRKNVLIRWFQIKIKKPWMRVLLNELMFSLSNFQDLKKL